MWRAPLWAADSRTRTPPAPLIVVTLGLVTSSAVLYVARSHPLPAVVAILAWALFASSAPPSMQHRAMSLAGPGGALVASLPASAASAGIALGSSASGVAYAAAGPSAVIITGMIIALGALALAVATRRLRPPADEPTATAPLTSPVRAEAAAALGG
jgi:DHA1 family inner membrane transport protein